ncbi:MAG: DUF6600 domain-containing protein [Candidatus Polarisedimenticolia bacterium]
MNSRRFRPWYRSTFLSFAVVALAALASISQPRAQEEPVISEEQGSTYARLRYSDGRVTVERLSEGSVEDATTNLPLAAGDRIQAEAGRAEMVLADGSTLWLDEGSRLELRNLSDLEGRFDTVNLMVLDRGSLRVEAADPIDGREFRIDTPAGSVSLLSEGSFRIDVDGGVVTVSSFRGVAEIAGDAGSVMVRTGERTSVRGGGIPSDPRRFNTARLDDFDRFCGGRLEAFLRPGTGEDEEIQEELPGEIRPHYRELSVYGDWHSLPTYGWVWRPYYLGSWGPYWHGYWSWAPSGWIWVSYDPWGWAPYRYGRWDFVTRVGWVWIPGRVWRGAWVSFAVGRSYLGWCPLNYYNRPVFHDVSFGRAASVRSPHLDPRSWRFARLGRVADRGAVLLRADRLPRDTELVLSDRLPRFNPREVAANPERGRVFQEGLRRTRASRPAVSSNKAVPFRDLERGAASGRVRAREGGGAPETGQRRPTVRQREPQRSPVTPRVAPRPRGARPSGTAVSPRRQQPPRSATAPPAQGRPGARSSRTPAPPRRVAPGRKDTGTPGHVVERLFEKARGERAKPATPQARGGSRVQPPAGREGARAQPAPSREKPRAEARGDQGRRAPPAPPRPPRKDNDRER